MKKKLKTPKKLPPRRKKSKKKSFQKYITLAITVFITILLASFVGTYFYIEDKEIVINIQKEKILEVKPQEKQITYEEKTKALEIEYVNNIDNNIYIQKRLKQDKPKFHYEEPDYGKVDEISPQKEDITNKEDSIFPKTKIEEPYKKQDSLIKENKPRLAIVIDDVTTKSQVRKIQNIGYPINISFLPPTSGHKNSAKIAQELENYMIHLPLQASSSRFEEEDTLHITDTFERIDAKVASLKALYPKAKFINNHTGSKFTANEEAMDKLCRSLKKHGYYFLDSRTTAKSVAKKSAKKFGLKMYSRNIFLDNKKDTKYIRGQLKKAVRLAKKNGRAIAIGHPFNITFDTLKNSHDLLEGLELVFIESI